MTELLFAAATAFWLGLLTSLSPCPMANTVAAISYITRSLTSPKRILLAGILYTAGRTLTYTVLGFILVKSLMSAPVISLFLQRNINVIIGPVLILVGMVLLDLISIPLPDGAFGRNMDRFPALSLTAPFLLGVLFALSFCAVPAALFFGSLVPLAIQHQSALVLPALYGIATGLPVLLFSVLLAGGLHKIGVMFNKLTAFERWARRVTGVIFILVGILNSLVHIFHVRV